jgi:hypothetical protein
MFIAHSPCGIAGTTVRAAAILLKKIKQFFILFINIFHTATEHSQQIGMAGMAALTALATE